MPSLSLSKLDLSKYLLLVCQFQLPLVQFAMIKFVYPLTKEKVAEMNQKLGRTNEVDVVSAMQED